MKYFAYGSNLAIKRLRQRTPSAQLLGVYHLENYALRFHKMSKDGSGKCNAFFTGVDTDVVEGAIYEIDSEEVPDLDKAESYGYEKQCVEVTDAGGNIVSAFTYIATKIDDSLLPFSWYKNHVLTGAKALPLSPAYIASIEQFDASKDHDKTREQRELAVHEL